MYTQFLDEDDFEERELGLEIGLILLSKCREYGCLGVEYQKGLAVEIEKAKSMKIPIRYQDIHCKKVGGDKVMEARDCFAYKNRRCIILTITRYQGLDFPFYKTKHKFKEDQEKAKKRILSLDKEFQNHINEIYYGGKIGGNLNDG